jgi:hypothetical protein
LAHCINRDGTSPTWKQAATPTPFVNADVSRQIFPNLTLSGLANHFEPPHNPAMQNSAEPQKTSYRPRSSKKAPVIKTEVIAPRAQGQSKSKIAREMGIAYNTASSVIRLSNIDEMLEDGRIQSANLIPEAIRVAKARLAQNSENMAIKVLENSVWPIEAKATGNPINPRLENVIQMLLHPGAEVTVNMQGDSTVKSGTVEQSIPPAPSIRD